MKAKYIAVAAVVAFSTPAFAAPAAVEVSGTQHLGFSSDLNFSDWTSYLSHVSFSDLASLFFAHQTSSSVNVQHFDYGASPNYWTASLTYATSGISYTSTQFLPTGDAKAGLVPVPGPTAGAGIGALAMAGIGFLAMRRKKTLTASA